MMLMAIATTTTTTTAICTTATTTLMFTPTATTTVIPGVPGTSASGLTMGFYCGWLVVVGDVCVALVL